MPVFILFIVYGLIFNAAADKVKEKPVKDRKINLALETVVEFNENDNANDIKFLDKVQQFIGKVKTAIDKNDILRRDYNGGNFEKFTDFLLRVIKVLNRYNDLDLEHFFDIFNEEIRKYHYRGCKFYELTDNLALRKFIATELDTIKYIPAHVIRTNLMAKAHKIKEEKYTKKEKKLVDFINSLYRQEAGEKLRSFLTNIDDYRLNVGKKKDLKKIVRDGVRSIIFDHYSQLNQNARRAFKTIVNEYWNDAHELSEMIEHYVGVTSYAETYKPTTRNKNHYSKTTEEKRTYRQMYVEKNIDLKYNPYSYDRFTTASKSIPRYPPTETVYTARPIKVRNVKGEVEYKEREHNINMLRYDKDLFKEWKERRDDFEIKSRNKYKTKATNALRTLRQMYVEKNLDLKYNPDLYEQTTARSRTKHKKTTRAKPKARPTTIRSTTRSQGNEKKSLRYSTQKRKIRTFWDEGSDYLEIDEIKQRANLSPRSMEILQMETAIPFIPSSNVRAGKMKYEVQVKGKPKQPDNRKQYVKSSTSRRQKILSKKKNKYRRAFLVDHVVSDEGLSIEDFKAVKLKNYRRSESNTSNIVTIPPASSTTVDTNVLTRIQQLEKELNFVKTQIKNDTEIISSLNNKVKEKQMKLEEIFNKKSLIEEIESKIMKQIENDNNRKEDRDNKNRLTKVTSINLTNRDTHYKNQLSSVPNDILDKNEKYESYMKTTKDSYKDLIEEDKVINPTALKRIDARRDAVKIGTISANYASEEAKITTSTTEKIITKKLLKTVEDQLKHNVKNNKTKEIIDTKPIKIENPIVNNEKERIKVNETKDSNLEVADNKGKRDKPKKKALDDQEDDFDTEVYSNDEESDSVSAEIGISNYTTVEIPIQNVSAVINKSTLPFTTAINVTIATKPTTETPKSLINIITTPKILNNFNISDAGPVFRANDFEFEDKKEVIDFNKVIVDVKKNDSVTVTTTQSADSKMNELRSVLQQNIEQLKNVTDVKSIVITTPKVDNNKVSTA